MNLGVSWARKIKDPSNKSIVSPLPFRYLRDRTKRSGRGANDKTSCSSSFSRKYAGKLLKQCWRSGANQNQLRFKELCGKMRHVGHGMISRSFRIT